MSAPRLLRVRAVVLSDEGDHFTPLNSVPTLWEEWHPKDDKSIGQKGEDYSTFDKWIDENKDTWKKKIGACPLVVNDIREDMNEVEMIARFHPLRKYKKWKSLIKTPKPLPEQIDLDKMLEDKELHLMKTFFVACDGRKRVAGNNGELFLDYFERYKTH